MKTLQKILSEIFRIFQIRLVLFVVILLSSCTHIFAKRDWEYTWTKSTRPSNKMELFVVNQDVVNQYCNQEFHAFACAVMTENSCKVYTSYKTLPKFIIQHEEKHCDGWDHN